MSRHEGKIFFSYFVIQFFLLFSFYVSFTQCHESDVKNADRENELWSVKNEIRVQTKVFTTLQNVCVKPRLNVKEKDPGDWINFRWEEEEEEKKLKCISIEIFPKSTLSRCCRLACKQMCVSLFAYRSELWLLYEKQLSRKTIQVSDMLWLWSMCWMLWE